MTHNQGMMKSQNAKRGDDLSAIRHSLFIRYSSFVIRHFSLIRHFSFVVFTRVVLVLVVAVAVSCSGKRITKANVDQVTDGMSKKQVESILGPPTSRTTDVYVYRQGKDTIAIVFKDDKVQSKDSTLHD